MQSVSILAAAAVVMMPSCQHLHLYCIRALCKYVVLMSAEGPCTGITTQNHFAVTAAAAAFAALMYLLVHAAALFGSIYGWDVTSLRG